MSKKICFIGSGLKGGGQERALSSLANFYAAKGHKVFVINLFKTEQFFELDPRISIIWPDIDRINHKRLTYAILILPYLRRSVKRTKADVHLSFGEWFNPYVILATRAMRISLFLFDRMGPEMKMDPLVSFLRKLLYRFASGVIVQTGTAADIVAKKTGARNVHVIPNPLNPIDVEILSKKNQIVTLGRLSPEKGHIVLIRAFSRVKNKDWTLHFIGDGPERAVLEKEASDLGLYSRVIFHGHLKDFKNILGESDIFVLPSFYEGFPNALIEAMSVPLPCISSNCVAGPSDIISAGINGILVEPGNFESLANALNLLIENPAMRMKFANEAYKVREKLAFDKIMERYSEVIFRGSNIHQRKSV